jgi:2-polyprenyl-6-methoxyphenol hydroxylase-like FAD-dependent oxidoreductase
MNRQIDFISAKVEPPPASHAIVIGGSMAGLLAGRVLTDFFERVTIIERDRFADAPAPRKGVPQARHLHALLTRGRSILEQLFPGILKELAESDALLYDVASDILWHTPAGWGARFKSNLGVLACSRDLLEWSTRRRLAALPRVRFIEERDVVGLVANKDRNLVVGARLRSSNPEEGMPASEEELYADLVVDASGRGSKAPQWLKALGYAQPEETVINSFLGYASRTYERPAELHLDCKGIYIQAAPPEHTRGGIAFPIEGNRWMVTLVGLGRDYPPTDETGFLEFARSLRTPVLYGAIKDAEPLSPIYSHRGTENRLRHYERLSRRPEGFVVVGDSACAFNPVYGQGMTMAALGALALGELLAKQSRRQREGELRGFAARFQRRLAKVNQPAWMLATGEDFRVKGAEGGTPDRMTKFMQKYVDNVVLLSTKSASVRRRLLEVFNMEKPPTSLFHPGILIRMLWQRVMRVPQLNERVLHQTGIKEFSS